MNTEITFPLITLALGVILGFVSSLFIEMFRQRTVVTQKVLDHFFVVREDVCEIVSDLANLKIGRKISKKLIADKREQISKLFYKHYDFLPKRVLQELNCLYACLSDSQNRMFVIKNNALLLLPEEDLQAYIANIAVVENFRYYAYIPLKSDNLDERRSACINYQARHTLKAINDELTLSNLLKWGTGLPK